jgi:chitin disaccharide deacetylase
VVGHDLDLVTERLLIVNADDYGLTLGISRGILEAHRHGIVTSASVLAIGPAYPKVADWLLDEGDLGIGVHLAAVGEDPPLLTPDEIPTLLDDTGRLCHTYGQFVARAATGRVDPDDLTREFTAQLEVVQDLGLPITHLDAHQHLQLWPPVREVVLDLALRFGIPAVRVPRYRSLMPVGVGVTLLGRRLARRAVQVGLHHPLDAVGIECAGCLDAERLPRVLSRLAAGGKRSVELTVHPGEGDDEDRARYAWGYRWEDELAALSGPGARDVVARHGFALATYADLP